jgi:hypothetical protein
VGQPGDFRGLAGAPRLLAYIGAILPPHAVRALKFGPIPEKLLLKERPEGVSMRESKSRAELHDILRSLLRDALRLHQEGAAGSRLGQADGYVDGFIRALVESGVSDHAAILALVREVRREVSGPPTGAADTATLAA